MTCEYLKVVHLKNGQLHTCDNGGLCKRIAGFALIGGEEFAVCGEYLMGKEYYDRLELAKRNVNL